MLSAGTIVPFTARYSSKSAAAAGETPLAGIANTIPPAVFPLLTLQGITLHGQKSSALINGQVLFLGDGIGNARVLEIEGSQVTMEMEGQTEVLALEE